MKKKCLLVCLLCCLLLGLALAEEPDDGDDAV